MPFSHVELERHSRDGGEPTPKTTQPRKETRWQLMTKW